MVTLIQYGTKLVRKSIISPRVHMKYTKYTKNRVTILLAGLLSLGFLSNASGTDSQTKILNLHEVYSLAMKNHEQILIAEKEIAKSKLLPKKADSIMLPKVNIYGEYREYDDDISFEADVGNVTLPPVITVPKNQTGGNLEIVQPLYKGSWQPRKQQANQSVIRDKEDFTQVAQDILFQVSQIYYEVVKSKELINLSQEILKLSKEEKRVAQARFAEGAVTEDAVLNADLKITATQSKLIEYGNRLVLAQKILKRYIGDEVGPFDVVTPDDLPLDDRGLSELVHIALDSRHDYKKVQAMVDIARSDVDLAKSRFFPSLESSWDYFSVDNPSYYQDTDYWILAVKLTIPIYEGGLRYWDFKEKKENVDQAVLAANDFDKNIRIEVEQAMLEVETTQGILANLKKQEELAQKNYDIVFSKFKFGAASTVDLNQAISTLDAVKTELTVNKIDFQISLLKLQKAIGIFGREIIPVQ